MHNYAAEKRHNVTKRVRGGGRRSRRARLAGIVAAAALTLLAAPSAAQAEPVLQTGFEGGLPAGWTADGLWHVQSSPQAISVLSPTINPNLVTLPDAGALPSAFEGSSVAWFGDASSGTFCGSAAWVAGGQAPKNGCTSQTTQTGSLTSPSFSLAGALSAQVEFQSWWEIEGVDANEYDLMHVEYSTNGGGTWTEAGRLNPSDDPDAEHYEPYTANGVRQPATWHRYVADLSGAAGAGDVRLRFRFDSDDAAYQGFRGWLVDAVTVETPYAEPAPRIDALEPDCTRAGQGRIVAIEGAHFVLGSKVLLDGTELTSATPSSERMEFVAPATLPTGSHTVRVVRTGANAAQSNTATFQVRADCAAKRSTATQIRCDRGPNPWDPSRCTATVGDSDVPQRTTPTGTVRFSSADGAFTQTYQCNLAATPLSPGVASCAVQNVPAGKDGFASVRADYLGSAAHAPSSATTGFIVAGGSGPAPDVDSCKGPTAAAKMSINNDYQTFNQPGLDFGDVGWCAQMLLIDGIQGVTHVVNGVAYVVPPVVGVTAGVLEPIPAPQMKVAAGVIAYGAGHYAMKPVHALADHTVKTLETTQKDPPDPKFKKLGKPVRVKVPVLVPGRGIKPKQAKRLTALARQLAKTQGLARALTATLDRAGGAIVAGDQVWQGRQMAHAIKLARRLSVQYNRSARAIVRIRPLARKMPQLKRKYKLAKVKRTARRIVKRGYTKGQIAYMRKLGYTKRDLAKIKRGQKDVAKLKKLPFDQPLDAFGKATVDALRTAARAYSYWVVLPEITEQAKLGRRR